MKKSDSNVTLTQRQIWGVAVLLMLIIIGISCWRLLPMFNEESEPPQQINIDWQKQTNKNSLDQVTKFEQTEDRKSYQSNDALAEKANVKVQLFPFDPNTASVDDFVKLGLRPKVAQTIINYRNKGGKFYKKEDLSKIYTLSDEDYERLAPYIKITSVAPRNYDNKSYTSNNYSKTTYENNYENKYPKKSNAQLSINTSNAEQFMQLKGIGTGYANKIVKYREILGGYHQVEQLKEVYGMTDSLYEAIKPFIIIDKDNIVQIDVNQATEQELYKHPYIRKMAKYIITYRNDIGGFKRIEDFKQVPLINEEIYRKIVPYLSIKN